MADAGPSNAAATAGALAVRSAHGIVPQLQNTVATVNLDTRLDLKSIALHSRNSEYNPKVKRIGEEERREIHSLFFFLFALPFLPSPSLAPRPSSPFFASELLRRPFLRSVPSLRAEMREKEREASEKKRRSEMPPPPATLAVVVPLFLFALPPHFILFSLLPLSTQNSASPPSSCASATRRRRR